MHSEDAPLSRVEPLRQEGRSLLLDGGDALSGSNTAWRWTEPILLKMRRLGYAAMAMGNREFHYFRWVQRWREQEREFPLLAANLVDLTRPQWPWRRSLERHHDGIRVALVGATPVQYPVGSPWERLTGFRFLDPVACLPGLCEELRARNDAVVLLSHLGLKADLQLADRGLAVDLILGGHSHDLTPEPLWRGKTAVVQGGSHGRYLGELELDPGDSLRCEFHACR